MSHCLGPTRPTGTFLPFHPSGRDPSGCRPVTVVLNVFSSRNPGSDPRVDPTPQTDSPGSVLLSEFQSPGVCCLYTRAPFNLSLVLFINVDTLLTLV